MSAPPPPDDSLITRTDLGLPVLSAPADSDRSCGECTACCTLLRVVELRKPQRFACDHVCREGCRIYEERPLSCREFSCGWLRGETPTDPQWRPDRLGVMVDSWTERQTGDRYVVLFEMWPEACADPRVEQWLRERRRHDSVEVSYRDGTWISHPQIGGEAPP